MWLIISDTHDNIPNVKKFMEIALSKGVKTVFHLGDLIAPFLLPYLMVEGVDFYGVFGNNDGERLLTTERSKGRVKVGPYEVEKDGKKVFVMHEQYSLKPAIASQLYDYVFYGHTHELDIRKEGKTLVINPGEACGYLTNRATAVILNPESGEYEVIEL